MARIKEPIASIRVEKGFEPHEWCAECKIGLVSDRIFRDPEAYNAARRADRIMKRWGTHCEACDIAALTDGECPACHMAFKNGILTKGKHNPYAP